MQQPTTPTTPAATASSEKEKSYLDKLWEDKSLQEKYIFSGAFVTGLMSTGLGAYFLLEEGKLLGGIGFLGIAFIIAGAEGIYNYIYPDSKGDPEGDFEKTYQQMFAR
jgi:hypothetical protein